MANWTDGPEYAPVERPAAFQSPDVAPLESPAPAVSAVATAPVEAPRFEAPSSPAPDLASLVPVGGPQRDPRQAFSVAQAAMTSSSAWTAAHSTAGTLPTQAWDPRLPLIQSATTTVTYAAPAPNFPPPRQNQSPFPQPGTADWFAPSIPAPQQTGPRPVTVAQMWRAATPGVMVPLILGGFLPGLSMIMLALSFSLSSRVTHRRRQVRLAYGITGVGLLAVGALSMLDSSIDLPMFWDVVSSWARWACWLLGIAILLVVGAGLRNGEPEERPF